MKFRSGGLKMEELSARILDGETRAMRALVRQSQGVNTLDLPAFRADVPALELREVANGTGGTRLRFNGYASVAEAPYTIADQFGDYTEIVRTGAWTRTLQAGADVIFCVNHDWTPAPMARTGGTMTLTADTIGLLTEASLDPGRADVYAMRSAMDDGSLRAMSFAFYVTRQVWSEDYSERSILEVDMDGGDASAVTHPASPATEGTTALRGKQAAAALTRVAGLLRSVQAGPATDALLTSVLALVAEADRAVDAAQPLLAGLLGVPNPDDDDDDGETPVVSVDPASGTYLMTSTDSSPAADEAPRSTVAAARLRLAASK